MPHHKIVYISLSNFRESFEIDHLIALGAPVVVSEGEVDERRSIQVGGIEIDAGGHFIDLGGEDDLDHPDHEGHVDEDEDGGWSFDDDVDEHIECVFVFV